jgi:hypothetical protein
MLRAAVSRFVTPSLRGSDSVAMNGSGTSLRGAIGAPRESPPASRYDADAELAPRLGRLRARSPVAAVTRRRTLLWTEERLDREPVGSKRGRHAPGPGSSPATWHA